MRHSFAKLLLAILGVFGGGAFAGAEQPVSDAQRAWWAFQPLAAASPPEFTDDSWVRTEIDRFVLAKMQEHGLQPAPQQERRAWIRRAKFALVGLPPTSAEIDDFLKDASPHAYEQLVDRWLNSPQFGEH